MRHRKGFNHLSRKAPHRRAMLANMAASLIKEKRITTTTAKAKALRSFVEPLITKSKNDTTHSRRVVFSYLQDKDAVSELFREVSPKVMERAGGYTRILKLDQNRLGDNAELAMIELVDFNPNLITEPKEKTGGSRRRRRGGKKKSGDQQTSQPAAETTEATTQTDEAEKDVKDQAETQEEVKAEEATRPETNEEESKAEESAQDKPEASAEPKTEEKSEEKPEAKATPEEEPKADTSEEKPAEEEKKDDDKEDKKES
jgi:large subunit ribosomal protein L17